jgi:hypothetical protein
MQVKTIEEQPDDRVKIELDLSWEEIETLLSAAITDALVRYIKDNEI